METLNGKSTASNVPVADEKAGQTMRNLPGAFRSSFTNLAPVRLLRRLLRLVQGGAGQYPTPVPYAPPAQC